MTSEERLQNEIAFYSKVVGRLVSANYARYINSHTEDYFMMRNRIRAHRAKKRRTLRLKRKLKLRVSS